MTTWAKEVDNALAYASDEEFKGIPHWEQHETCVRNRGYLPLEGTPEPREGYIASPATWHIEQCEAHRTEPRQKVVPVYEEDPETHEQKQVGERTIMEDTEITLDKSFIHVDTWEYTPIPEPEPPDTTERDNAEKAIVAAIKALAVKYNALDDLLALDDITIPNLSALATAKGVPEAEFGALITELTPYKWQLEAVTGLVWAEAWEGLKSRFVQWMQEAS